MLSSDEKLVERCLEGADDAWEIILNRHGRRIYNLCYRYTNRHDEAEDLTQEIFIRVYRNLKLFRREAGSFLSWMLKLGRNLIIDHHRKTRRMSSKAGSDELEAMNLPDDKLLDPQRAAEQMEASRFLWDGLQALAVELREAIVLRDLEGLAYREMSELLGIPEGTVKSRINRARLELAKILIKRRAHIEI